jgi:RNA polymerase sigma-32 factor
MSVNLILGRRLAGDVSLNAPIGDERDPADWQDWLVDEASDQETRLADDEEAGNRRQALVKSLALRLGDICG